MIQSKPEDQPKVIALLVLVLVAFTFIGVRVVKFNSERSKSPSRVRDMSLVMQVPTITQSTGTMKMWGTAKWPVPDPFYSKGLGNIEYTPPPVSSAPPPTSRPSVPGGQGPVATRPTRDPVPPIRLNGVIMADNGLGDMAVFSVGDVTKTMRAGQPIANGVTLVQISSDGALIRDLGKTVRLSINETYAPK